MTTDTCAAESEAGMDDVQRFHTVEDIVIFHHPDWAYLNNQTLDVRPPTEDEAAVYAARAQDPLWADLYAPHEPPRVILPPSAEVAALLDPQPEWVSDLEADTGPPADDVAEAAAKDATRRWAHGHIFDDDPEAEAKATKFLATFALDPEGEADRPQPGPDQHEVHHDTQVIETAPEVSG